MHYGFTKFYEIQNYMYYFFASRVVDMLNLSSTEDIVETNLTSPYGLAVDWMANNIYWTDYGRRVLQVARIDGTCRKTIITSDLHQPRSIALFPRKG